MSDTSEVSTIRQLLADHVGREIILYLRDYMLIDGTHARCVQRDGVVHRVTDEDVEILNVSQFTKEAVVHAIKLDHILEVQGKLLNESARQWFAGTEAARNMQWSGLGRNPES